MLFIGCRLSIYAVPCAATVALNREIPRFEISSHAAMAGDRDSVLALWRWAALYTARPIASFRTIDRKPAAVVSVSPGAIGGFGTNHHLCQSLVFMKVPAMPQPEAYIGGGRSAVRQGRKYHERRHAKVFEKLHGSLCRVDRGPSGPLKTTSCTRKCAGSHYATY